MCGHALRREMRRAANERRAAENREALPLSLRTAKVSAKSAAAEQAVAARSAQAEEELSSFYAARKAEIEKRAHANRMAEAAFVAERDAANEEMRDSDGSRRT